MKAARIHSFGGPKVVEIEMPPHKNLKPAKCSSASKQPVSIHSI